jgi:hypothetical protein
VKRAIKKVVYFGAAALVILVVVATVHFVSFAMPPQGGKALQASKCSLPVVSTVVLEYPVGSPHVTATLRSAPGDIPTVNTEQENLTSHTMGSVFVSLNLSGTFNGQPIKSVLNGDFPSKGRVENVRHTGKGEFAGGHHILQVYQVYTIGSVSFFNKQPIVLAADINSQTPSGRTYTKQGAGPVSLYDKSDPTKVIAKLYSLSNQVQ